MSTERPLHALLSTYAESHQHPVNILVHWVCVPVIFFCVVGLLAAIPSPELPFIHGYLWLKLALLATLVYYALRSIPLFIGMVLWCLGCFTLVVWIDLHAPWPLWAVCLVLFAAAWIGQFIGHAIEGKRPSFLQDVQFLLIGPAWLLAKVYRRLGIPY